VNGRRLAGLQVRFLRDQGGNMVVKSPTDATRRLFEITGLSTVFELS
jgi:anti-anti-sigma regulatory factor